MFANRSGQESLFEMLFGPQASMASSFIASDDIHSLKALKALNPDPSQLTKLDAGRKNCQKMCSYSFIYYLFIYIKNSLADNC